MIARLAKWRGSEPVILLVFPVLAILVGYALTVGIVDGSAATIILGVLGLVLGVPATVVARSQVTPAGKAVAKDAALDAVEQSATMARELARDKFGDQGSDVIDAVAQQIRDRVRGL